MTHTHIAQLAILVCIAACTKKSSPCPHTDTPPKTCEPPEICPKNAPSVNLFPVNGLSADGVGRCNGESVKLATATLDGKCGPNASLTIDSSNRLVGRNGDKQCSGEELRGSTFWLHGSDGRVQLTIKNVEMIRKPAGEFEAYQITYGDESVCIPAVSARVRKKLGLEAYRARTTDTFPAHGELAIVVPGTIYTTDIQVWPLGGSWFNLACVSDALGEVVLEGLYRKDPAEVGINRAALHMFTATYRYRSFTTKGVELGYDGAKTDESKPILEAHWTETGATCVDNPRLLSSKFNGKPADPRSLPFELQPWLCMSPFSRCNTADAWTAMLRLESGLKACSNQPSIYKSYVSQNSTWQAELNRP